MAVVNPNAYSYGGQFTPEERAYYMANMPDISEQEEHLARQRALAESLRTNAAGLTGQRMDWASQAARAFQGAQAGFERRKADEDTKAFRNRMLEVFKNAPRPQPGG